MGAGSQGLPDINKSPKPNPQEQGWLRETDGEKKARGWEAGGEVTLKRQAPQSRRGQGRASQTPGVPRLPAERHPVWAPAQRTTWSWGGWAVPGAGTAWAKAERPRRDRQPRGSCPCHPRVTASRGRGPSPGLSTPR